MNDLVLNLDSYLKMFKLYELSDELLKTFADNYPFTEGVISIDKLEAESLYPQFIDLASMLDNFKSWGDREWTNFVVCMRSAFLLKGLGSSIDSALSAIGVKVESPTTVGYDDSGNWSANIFIDTIPTPDLTKFNSYLSELIKRLIWVKDKVEIRVKIVLVDVKLLEEYRKIIYSKEYCWFEVGEVVLK